MTTVECEKLISRKRFLEITDKFSSLSPILVVGDVGIDKYTQGSVNKISPEAPVPVLEVEKQWHKLGLAANISHNLSTIGIASDLCGVVGSDANAQTFKELLSEIKIDTKYLIESKERPTIFKERVVTNTQQICRIDYEDKSPLFETESRELRQKLSGLGQTFKSVILEDYAKGMMSEDEAKWIISTCIKSNIFIGVDPGRTTPPMYYYGATLLKPNLLEAKVMVAALGHPENLDLATMAKILVEKLNLKMLIITLGADGMALLDTQEETPKLKVIPTAANEVFDVSGAGDTAMALIISSLNAGATLEEAAWISNCGSGVVVAKRGTATVNLQELRDFHLNLSAKL